jgi:hypothetical protein
MPIRPAFFNQSRARRPAKPGLRALLYPIRRSLSAPISSTYCFNILWCGYLVDHSLPSLSAPYKYRVDVFGGGGRCVCLDGLKPRGECPSSEWRKQAGLGFCLHDGGFGKRKTCRSQCHWRDVYRRSGDVGAGGWGGRSPDAPIHRCHVYDSDSWRLSASILMFIKIAPAIEPGAIF